MKGTACAHVLTSGGTHLRVLDHFRSMVRSAMMPHDTFITDMFLVEDGSEGGMTVNFLDALDILRDGGSALCETRRVKSYAGKDGAQAMLAFEAGRLSALLGANERIIVFTDNEALRSELEPMGVRFIMPSVFESHEKWWAEREQGLLHPVTEEGMSPLVLKPPYVECMTTSTLVTALAAELPGPATAAVCVTPKQPAVAAEPPGPPTAVVTEPPDPSAAAAADVALKQPAVAAEPLAGPPAAAAAVTAEPTGPHAAAVADMTSKQPAVAAEPLAGPPAAAAAVTAEPTGPPVAAVADMTSKQPAVAAEAPLPPENAVAEVTVVEADPPGLPAAAAADVTAVAEKPPGPPAAVADVTATAAGSLEGSAGDAILEQLERRPRVQIVATAEAHARAAAVLQEELKQHKFEELRAAETVHNHRMRASIGLA